MTATAMLGILSPLVAATLGAVLLAETLTGIQLLGFALALIALVAGLLTGAPIREVAREQNVHRGTDGIHANLQ